MQSESAVQTVIDIETSATQTYVWGLWDQHIQPNMIIEDWQILSFAAKQVGESDVIYREARTKDQEIMLLIDLWKILDESDIIIAHNGKKFDIKKINARLMTNNIKPYSPIKIIDTLIEVRRIAAFTSNKLEFLTETLCTERKLKHQKFPGFELWKQCLAGNPEAWAEMQEYNIQDVVSLEELYLKIRPWIKGHPNLGNYVKSETPVCPKCGSDAVVKWGTARTQVGTYQKYKCNGCGGYSRGRTMMFSAEERKHILVGQ